MSHFQAILRVLATFALLCTATRSVAVPFLINAQQADFRNRPEYVRDHFAHIESLPFDGMTITSGSGAALMNGSARSYAEVARDFASLDGLPFTRMRHNFAHVNVDRPADFFGDWSVTIENFRVFARVLKEKGIEGIFFDNEEYARLLFNYPEDCDDPAKTLDEYRDQARLRGREIARAISGEFPDIVFLVYHGPYSSFEGTPEEVRRGQTDWVADEMRGPFSAGLIEGLDSRARFVDGGEVFAYRTTEDFQLSYDYRKTGIVAAGVDCPYISRYLRPVWSAKVGISFGLYNRPISEVPMDPAILRPTLEHALRRCDDFVWLYCEGLNWNAPDNLPTAWVDAVIGARAVTRYVPGSVAPWVSIASPGVASRFNAPAIIRIDAKASDADGSVNKVEFFSGTTKLGESLNAPFQFEWTNPAAGTHSLTAVATDDSGATATSSAVSITVGSTFSASINFQSSDVTAPPGYFADTGEVYGAHGNGLTYGWSVSHTDRVRDRRDHRDRRLATLCEMTPGSTWELEVPNGIYRITIAIGDGTYPSTYTLNVEGVTLWDARALAAAEFLSRTAVVAVNDGRLSIDPGQSGNSATRINYLIVAALFAPPPGPASVSAEAASSNAIEVKWADNSSSEIGFQMQRSTDPNFSQMNVIGTAPANTTTFLDETASAGTTYFYRVRALGTAGNSEFAAPASAIARPPDLDEDGIPDPLENGPCIAGIDDRQIDSDHDGFSNAAEYLAGTDPLDSQSFPKISALTWSKSDFIGTEFRLVFPSVAGRRYFVDFTDDLAGGIWTLVPESDRTGDGAMQIVADTSVSPSRFFRVRVWK